MGCSVAPSSADADSGVKICRFLGICHKVWEDMRITEELGRGSRGGEPRHSPGLGCESRWDQGVVRGSSPIPATGLSPPGPPAYNPTTGVGFIGTGFAGGVQGRGAAWSLCRDKSRRGTHQKNHGGTLPCLCRPHATRPPTERLADPTARGSGSGNSREASPTAVSSPAVWLSTGSTPFSLRRNLPAHGCGGSCWSLMTVSSRRTGINLQHLPTAWRMFRGTPRSKMPEPCLSLPAAIEGAQPLRRCRPRSVAGIRGRDLR